MADSQVDLVQPERVEKILNAYVDRAEMAFKSRIASQGIVLTGETLNSFRQYTAERADGHAAFHGLCTGCRN